MPSTTYVSGLNGAIACIAGASRARGKNAGAVNSSMKTSGNRFCSSDSEPVRSAIAAANPPRPAAVSDAIAIVSSTPPTPPS